MKRHDSFDTHQPLPDDPITQREQTVASDRAFYGWEKPTDSRVLEQKFGPLVVKNAARAAESQEAPTPIDSDKHPSLA